MQVASGRPRVVLVGGAGVFGQRLARLLAQSGGFDLVIAGRDREKAAIVARSLGAEAVVMDRGTANAEQIAALRPDAVVDCSGPFSKDGEEPYRLAEAALSAGANYLDIADGRDFVVGIGALDGIARGAGKFALAGASTTPALSSAVCDELLRGWLRVDSVEIGVTPGNRAPRGLAVVRSILSYAGRPIRVFRNGGWGTEPGWGLLKRTDISHNLKGRWLSLCDTPDLELFPTRYRVTDSVIFRGGLELSLLHLSLSAASQFVRLRMLPSLSLFAEAARDIADLMIGFGTDRGGMIVEVKGLDAGNAPVTRTWALVAEGGDGPNIPVLAAYACLNKMDRIAPGARPCMGEITLNDFEALFKSFRIRTEFR